MLSNPLWGWILDRAGLRRGMSAAVAWWTVASVAHAFAGGFWSFGAARAALGFGEGATFPGGLRTVVQTLPPHQRGRGLAVAYSGGSLGAVVTPLIVTPIFLWWGWRAAFWFTGLIGAAWLGVWALVSRRPDIRERMARHCGQRDGPRTAAADGSRAVGLHVRLRAGRIAAGLRALQRRALPGGPLGCSQDSSARCCGSRRSAGRSVTSSGAGSATAGCAKASRG